MCVCACLCDCILPECVALLLKAWRAGLLSEVQHESHAIRVVLLLLNMPGWWFTVFNIHSSVPHARDWLPVAGPQALAAPAGWLGSGTGCRTDLVLSCSGVPWAAVYWKVCGGEVRPKGTGMARSPVRFWVPSGPVGLLLSRCTKGRQVGASVKLCWPCG